MLRVLGQRSQQMVRLFKKNGRYIISDLQPDKLHYYASWQIMGLWKRDNFTLKRGGKHVWLLNSGGKKILLLFLLPICI
jgi:hypothetical protein